MNDAPLPYGRQWIDDDDIAAVVDCLRGDWLTQGPAVERFEQALCGYTGAPYAVAVASGTAALHLACMAAGVQPGDTGVTSAITFVASANGIAYCGGRPEFADVDPRTGLIDLDSLRDAVRRHRPRVIVPVDMAGQVAALPEIQRIAREVGAHVIEDAAHSLGAVYRHEDMMIRAGGCAHSDFAILSFHPVKNITTAEGGAILTRDPAAATRLRELRTHGIHRDPARLTRPTEGPWYYEQSELGYHYRLSDLQCALGLSQMQKLERFVMRRNDLAARYDRLLAPYADRVQPLAKAPGTYRHAYHLYVVQLQRRPNESLEDLAHRRKQVFIAMRECKIYCQIHYIPVPMQPYYRDRRCATDCGSCGAKQYYAGCLSLPLFPRMNDEDVDRVVAALAELA